MNWKLKLISKEINCKIKQFVTWDLGDDSGGKIIKIQIISLFLALLASMKLGRKTQR